MRYEIEMLNFSNEKVKTVPIGEDYSVAELFISQTNGNVILFEYNDNNEITMGWLYHDGVNSTTGKAINIVISKN